MTTERASSTNLPRSLRRWGNQVHLRSLRDAFATITPLYILAGIAVLINNVVFPLFPLDAAGLANLQTWGSAITLGTLNVSAIIWPV